MVPSLIHSAHPSSPTRASIIARAARATSHTPLSAHARSGSTKRHQNPSINRRARAWSFQELPLAPLAAVGGEAGLVRKVTSHVPTTCCGCGGGVAGEGGGCGASERATCAQPTKLAAAHGLRARRTEARRRQGDLCRMPCRRTHSIRISGRPRVRGRCVAPPAKKKATAPGPPRREPTRAAVEPRNREQTSARPFPCKVNFGAPPL